VERILDKYIQKRKVCDIPRGDDKPMNSRGRRNHRILKKMVPFSFHQSRPFSKARRIHRQNLAGASEPLHPRLNLLSFDTILNSSSFNSSLEFPKVTAERNICSSRSCFNQARTPP
jgi:hypothetical protein